MKEDIISVNSNKNEVYTVYQFDHCLGAYESKEEAIAKAKQLVEDIKCEPSCIHVYKATIIKNRRNNYD